MWRPWSVVPMPSLIHVHSLQFCTGYSFWKWKWNIIYSLLLMTIGFNWNSEIKWITYSTVISLNTYQSFFLLFVALVNFVPITTIISVLIKENKNNRKKKNRRIIPDKNHLIHVTLFVHSGSSICRSQTIVFNQDTVKGTRNICKQIISCQSQI